MVTAEEFFKLMRFPQEWIDWGMLPEELQMAQLEKYKPGHEDGSEHDRYGAFLWWLNKKPPPSQDELIKLIRLSYLDPDQLMTEDVRERIKCARNFHGPVIEVFNEY